jgi:uncharacterized membrane protein (UPF0136 family)
MRIRIRAELILVVGLILGYVSFVLGIGNDQPLAMGTGAAAMLLCAGVLTDMKHRP